MTWDPRKQLEAEDSPPEEMLDGARMIYGAIALAVAAIGLLAVWGGK